MARYYCQWDNAGGATVTWQGKSDWAKVTYGGSASDGATMDAASSALWDLIKGDFNETNKQAIKFGISMVPNSEWTTAGSDWVAPLKAYLPTNDVGTFHGIRPLACDRNYEVAPPGGAQSAQFTKTVYDTACAAVNTIITNSVKSNGGAYLGTNSQRTLEFAQFNEDHSRIYWDDAPAYITDFWGNSTSIGWQPVNQSNDFYEVHIWIFTDATTWRKLTWGSSSPKAMNFGSVDISGGGYTNSECLVAVCRASDDFAFQTWKISLATVHPDLTGVTQNFDVQASCPSGDNLQIWWGGTNFGGNDVARIYVSEQDSSGSPNYVFREEVPLTDRYWHAVYKRQSGATTKYVQVRVEAYEGGGYGVGTLQDTQDSTEESKSVNAVLCPDV